jgi:hypothetical protein
MSTEAGSIARAAQRTALASRALSAASEDLHAAALGGEAMVLEEPAEHVAGLALAIEQLEPPR